ncbi:nuclease-like protein [Branchiibius hedensis]|uniref:Nuclease-related domain-containing protein n=1 Tax=Branchiibius hedensis TaxID=672460 RepID=A0A2Y8ZTP3_9MICO|nr:NERD domain-containing protein [Branchiibius hedensis]PWJ26064.1 nuclease-like protein [Branchiibius hedensis]SSA34876.1 Nuclease-related domain-containing protein [Branchiibius hedensis]
MILVPALADIESRASSNAERTVARLLRDVEGDPDAVAFHSVDLRSHAYKQQAEADFVVLWRGVVVVIEVKGGGVRRHDGVWYSIDRRGDWHKLSGSPMEQARSAAYALRDILREEGAGWFAHEAVVITPDIDSPPSAVGWLPTHWLARDDMSAAGLQGALDGVVRNGRIAPNGQKRARMGDLRSRLFGEFTRMPVIDARRGAVLEEQSRATAGQSRVLAALARNPRVLVFGGAGTGKSLVLVEAAKQEADQGRSVLITFHSPALTGFFKPHIAGRSIDLVAFHELPNERAYDVVLVDEAQDMMTADAMDRIDTLIAGGRADGRWRMFLDPNNQAHVDGAYDKDVADLIASEAIIVDLDLNVRNTKAIVHVVQEYLGADVGDPGIVHGEKVQWCTPLGEAQIGAADRVAQQIVADGAHRSDVWIISTTSDAPPTTSPEGFVVTSPRYAKGLEAEHVVVFDLPQTYDEAANAALYVALTRARVSLHIITSKRDKRNLQQLLKDRMFAK